MATGSFRAAGDTVKVSPTRIRRSRRGSINIVLSLGFPSPFTALLAHSPRKCPQDWGSSKGYAATREAVFASWRPAVRQFSPQRRAHKKRALTGGSSAFTMGESLARAWKGDLRDGR